MGMLEELQELGVDIDTAISRLQGNRSLYEMLLPDVVEELEQRNVMVHFEAQDLEKALSDAHAIKGLLGNMAITSLFEAYTEIVRLIRANEPEAAKNLLEETLPLQDQILDCIRNNT